MDMLKNFSEFIEKINADNSRLYKISILEEYKNNEDIKYLLNFIYNPYIVTGISTKKLNKKLVFALFELTPLESLKEVLEYLKENHTGKDVDIASVCSYRDTYLPDDLKDLFNNIITKNVQIGVDTKTINKVMLNLIPEFSVQLANKYFDKPEIVEGKAFALTTKIDGGRIIAIKENNEVFFYTRAGQKYEDLVDLEEEFKEYFPDNICLDGEITLLNKGNLTSKDQYKETMKITRKDGEKHGVKMLVFDCMSADEFRNQCCPTSYFLRRDHLDRVFSEAETSKGTHIEFFEKLPILYSGEDTSKITEYLNSNIAKGEEGVMINMLSANYEFKRTNSLLKVKKMDSIDLEVIDIEEGTNKNKGRLGALIVEYKGNRVKVGSGFSDELRDEIWKNKEEWIGRIISIQYFEETKNQNNTYSLRFPVYLDYREDL